MKLEVPETLNDITVESYQELALIENPTQEDVLSCLLEIDRRDIRRLKTKSVDGLSKHLEMLLETPQGLQRTFKMWGKEWGFIPNLDDATYGEHIDIMESFDVKSWHKLMAVLYRPIKMKGKVKGNNLYAIEKYDPGKYDEVMKQAPLGVCLGAQLFFCDLMRDLSVCTLSYLEREELQRVLGSMKNGEDIANSIC